MVATYLPLVIRYPTT